MDCNLCNYAVLSCEDYPCSACKNTAVTDSEEYNARADMFESADENDVVNHPSHYTQGGVECIDAMESAFGAEQLAAYCKIAAFKYIWRCEYKNGLEDVKKAVWYLNKYIELKGDANDTV